MALFARQMRLMMELKIRERNGETVDTIAAQLKIPPFVAEKLSKQSAGFTLEQLSTGLKLLATADYKLKTGQSDSYMLEKFVVSLCNP